jgi:hypothetical protein
MMPNNLDADVIIRILDTSILPETEIFKDKGMSDILAKWKSQCQLGTTFNSSLCNKKHVGAHYFNKEFLVQHGSLNTTVDSLDL